MLYPDGTTQSCTWNSNDLKLSDTDEYGQTTYYTYDSYGNLLTSTNPLGEETAYTYSDDSGGTYDLLLTVTRVATGPAPLDGAVTTTVTTPMAVSPGSRTQPATRRPTRIPAPTAACLPQ